ncbi:MAG: hypothetical protein ACT4OX_09080 [Actinomycetota bacterium]
MSDWTTDATDAIDRAVALVRDRTVEPARAVTKGVVYGLLATLLVIPALVLLTIATFRLLVVYLPGDAWTVWCGLGGIFVALGGFLWSKRNA